MNTNKMQEKLKSAKQPGTKVSMKFAKLHDGYEYEEGIVSGFSYNHTRDIIEYKVTSTSSGQVHELPEYQVV